MSRYNNIHERNTYEVYRSIRRDWGNVNPVTKKIPDKRYKKPKYKNAERYDEE